MDIHKDEHKTAKIYLWQWQGNIFKIPQKKSFCVPCINDWLLWKCKLILWNILSTIVSLCIMRAMYSSKNKASSMLNANCSPRFMFKALPTPCLLHCLIKVHVWTIGKTFFYFGLLFKPRISLFSAHFHSNKRCLLSTSTPLWSYTIPLNPRDILIFL